MMLQGMAVEYLVRRTTGQTVLSHAAAGGIGLIASQWLKHLGAAIIGTAGVRPRPARARARLRPRHRVSRADVALRVREITGGKGAAVVYDGVGTDTFQASLDSVAPRGMLVSFGNASGAFPAFAPSVLAAKGSLFLTRPILGHYISTREELLESAWALFARRPETSREGGSAPDLRPEGRRTGAL